MALTWGAAAGSQEFYVVCSAHPDGDELCEFVELEDDFGRTRGPDRADWEPHPTIPGRWRLGPFKRADA